MNKQCDVIGIRRDVIEHIKVWAIMLGGFSKRNMERGYFRKGLVFFLSGGALFEKLGVCFSRIVANHSLIFYIRQDLYCMYM